MGTVRKLQTTVSGKSVRMRILRSFQASTVSDMRYRPAVGQLQLLDPVVLRRVELMYVCRPMWTANYGEDDGT